MYCNVCGSDIPDGATTCPVCGSPIVNAAPEQPQQPQAGYAEPQAQYEQPQADYYQPQAQYTQPQVDYAQPQAQYTQPQEGYVQPQAQYTQPQADYAQPQAQYNQPQDGYAQHTGYAQPGYTQSQAHYTQPQASYSQPQEAAISEDKPKKEKNKEEKPKGRRRALTVLSFTLCMLSLVAMTLTCIFPYWFFDSDSALFYFVIAGIGFIALVAFILFLLARKNALSIISGVLSVVVIAAALIFTLVIIPKAKDSLMQSFKEAVRHNDQNTMSRLDAYPYRRLQDFADDPKNETEIKNFLWDMFDTGNYSDWITSTKYVIETTTNYSTERPPKYYSEEMMKNKIWDKATEADARTLSYYTYLFEGTPLGESQDRFVKGFITKTKAAVEEYQYYETYGYDAPPPYTGFSFGNTSAETRIFGTILISEVHESMPTGSAYVVVNLSNGEYFTVGII